MQTRSKAAGQPWDSNPGGTSDDDTDMELERTQPLPEKESDPLVSATLLARSPSFCDIASSYEDPQAERTQTITAAEPKTVASQLKDQLIEKLRSENQGIYVCGRCRDVLDGYRNQVGCEGSCDRWFHADCAGLSDADYQNLLDVPSTKWICHECGITTCTTSIDSTIIETDLPSFEDKSDKMQKVKWGEYTGNELTTAISDIYIEVVQWQRNLFNVPTGKAGEMFIDEVRKVIKLFTTGSDFEPIALTILMIMFPLLLQKPSRSSKCKDHVRYLEKRLSMWQEGQLKLLVSESRAIQNRLTKKKRSSEEQEKAFVRLMLQGKISAAMRFIGSQSSSILPITDKVLSGLKEKHPPPTEASTGNTIKGPLPRSPCEEVIFENIDGRLIYTSAKKTSGSAGPSGTDAELWQRILCSRQFKDKPSELCDTW